MQNLTLIFSDNGRFYLQDVDGRDVNSVSFDHQNEIPGANQYPVAIRLHDLATIIAFAQAKGIAVTCDKITLSELQNLPLPYDSSDRAAGLKAANLLAA